MKIRPEVLEQIKWYLKVRHYFNFDGKPFEEIKFDRNGIDGIKAFYLVDSNGKKAIKPTKHPNIYKTIFKIKGSVNLHIKMWAEDRAKGILPKLLFDEMAKELDLPTWVVEAVENQKGRYY
jgi:hypothetical protein